MGDTESHSHLTQALEGGCICLKEINILPFSVMHVDLQKLGALSTAARAEHEKVCAQPALPELGEQKIETISQKQWTSWRTAPCEPP